MTTLVCQKLVSTLTQEIRLANDVRYNIAAMCPYVLMIGAPAGTFTLSISNGANIASKTFTCADIKSSLSTVNNYAHTFHPVIFDNPVFLERGNYDIILSASGYTPGPSSFIGWIQQHEDLNNELDYESLTADKNPLALRLKVYRGY